MDGTRRLIYCTPVAVHSLLNYASRNSYAILRLHAVDMAQRERLGRDTLRMRRETGRCGLCGGLSAQDGMPIWSADHCAPRSV